MKTTLTIEQSTGLIDCNGMEIFEGDIITNSAVSYEIVWCDDAATFMANDIAAEVSIPLVWFGGMSNTEVIGSIHNPALLRPVR